MKDRSERSGVRTDAFAAASATDRQIEALVDLQLARHDEFYPEDPRPTRDELWRRARSPDLKGMDSRWVLAQRGAIPVGYGGWDIEFEDNPRILWVNAYVEPQHRRQGVGSVLLAHVIEDVGGHHPDLVSFGLEKHTLVGQEIIHLVETEWGLAARYVERVSKLSLSEVDSAAVDEQLAERLARLGDRYAAHFFAMDDIPPPETGFRLEDFASMVEEIRNLMPLEDLSEEPETFDLRRFESEVARERKRGRLIWNYVMLDSVGRNCVGITNVCFNPDDPRILYQWDTGVLTSAQRQGIGKALKLLMLRKILDEIPGAAYIHTENAHSNAAMLAINESLGFKEHFAVCCYEIEVDRLRDLLQSGMRP